MQRPGLRGMIAATVVALAGQTGADLFAQPVRPVREASSPKPTGERKNSLTIVSVQLLTDDEAGSLKAYRWGQVFEKLKVSVTIRRSTPKDQPGVTEKKSPEGVRQVQVTGRLDRTGRVLIGDRAFTEEDTSKLGAWLDELREYGAQGSPAGQPAWGLTKSQFTVIFDALAKPFSSDPKGRTLDEAIKLFQAPSDSPLRPSAAATGVLREKGSTLQVGQSLSGVSQGTALSVILAEHGLGFRPKRAPNGAVDLALVTLAEEKDVWPVGWPRQTPGPQTAPQLYKFMPMPIELEDIELDAVLEAASDVIAMPVLVDKAGLAARNINLSQAKISHPRKRTTWGLALGTILPQANLKFELLVDEAGKPLVWITPIQTPRRAAAAE